MLEVEGKTFHKFIEVKEYKTRTYKNTCPLEDDYFPHENYVVKKNERFYEESFSLDESDYEKNYGNIFSEVNLQRSRIFVEEGENSISLKGQYYSRFRHVGQKYFVVRKSTYYVSFNYKTKIFYTGVFRGKNKQKIKTTLKVNPTFKHVMSNVYEMKVHKDINLDSYLYFFLEKIWDKICLENPQNFEFKDPYQLYSLTKYLVNGVKIPNNWVKFTDVFISKKDMKKSNMNLVDAVMVLGDLKGSKVKKILNEIEFVDFERLVGLYHILGVDKFNKLDNKIFDEYFRNGSKTRFDDSSRGGRYWSVLDKTSAYGSLNDFPKLSNIEKNKILNIKDNLDDRVYDTLLEHLSMKNQLKVLGEDVKLKFQSLDDFNYEHEQWSLLISSYRTGEVERDYGNVMELNNPIIYKNETYYPYLLTKTIDYEKESQHQRNCVRGYSERPDCLIFSIRKGSVDGDERVTVEYQFRQEGILNVQERAKFNEQPSLIFSEVAKIQLANINLLYKVGCLKLPKLTKKYKNGKIVKQISSFVNLEDSSKSLSFTPSWDVKTNEFSSWQNDILDRYDMHFNRLGNNFYDELF